MSQITVRTQPTWCLMLKILLFCGGFFALFMGLFSASSGDNSPILSALIMGSAFGALMALLMGGGHVLACRRNGHPGAVAPVQVAAVTIPESSMQAAEVIRRALARIGARETACWGAEHLVVLARFPVSWRSWGEEMRFECHPNADGSTEVLVTSRPVWPTTLVDWGKSLQNVKRFLSVVRLSDEPSNKSLDRTVPSCP